MKITESVAKPFIKWVGGKTQLIEQLEALLPADFDEWKEVTYIEPFVGGGAMLFYMLRTHANIQTAVINDINSDLTTCYRWCAIIRRNWWSLCNRSKMSIMHSRPKMSARLSICNGVTSLTPNR